MLGDINASHVTIPSNKIAI